MWLLQREGGGAYAGRGLEGRQADRVGSVTTPPPQGCITRKGEFTRRGLTHTSGEGSGRQPCERKLGTQSRSLINFLLCAGAGGYAGAEVGQGGLVLMPQTTREVGTMIL